MELVRSFNKLGKNDAPLAGGKGASLGEMTQAGIPVPPGFVVLSASFEQFIKETGLAQEIDAVLHKVNHKEIHTVETASETIRALILRAEMPKDIAGEISRLFKELNTKYVAVRSSATAEDGMDHAWAGQLESYLNTKEDDLLTKVKLCWSSLFTPRAIFYRFEKGLHSTKISVAVVVQKMVESEVSGIAFSVHPVTEDYNQLIIEAGFGLGEAIVSGSVTPDSYVVEKKPRNILDINVSTQDRALYRAEHSSAEHGNNEWRDIPEPKASSQVLTEKQILELAEIILGIENHYGFPCDIEWAFEKGKFYIVQSRPITTLTIKKNDKEADSRNFKWALDYLNTHSFDIKEARCSLLASDILFTPFAEKNCFGHGYSPIFVPYARQTLKQVITEEKMNGLERNVWDIFTNSPEKYRTALREANIIQAEIDKIGLMPEKLKVVKIEELAEYFSSLVELIHSWWRYGSIGEDKGLIVDEKIIPLLEKNHGLSNDNAREFVMTITTPSEQSIFSKERAAFLELCIEADSNSELMAYLKTGDLPEKCKKFTEKIQKYAEKYFYARSDFYSAKPFNIANVSQLIVEQCKKTATSKLKEELNHISENLDSLLKRKKTISKKVTLTKEEQVYIAYFSLLQEWIDTRKLSMLKHFTYVFYFLAELSERKNISYDTLSLMMVKEIEKIIKGETLDLKKIDSREEAFVIVYKERGEHLNFEDKEAEKLAKAISHSGIKTDSEIIKGNVASKSKTEKVINGIVRLVVDPSKNRFNEGEILVTSMTRPEFVPIMKSAGAIITDEGGVACHAAIVSRELGIPCIIGTKIATKVLKDGDMVEVDTDNGTIRIIKNKNQFISPELKDFNPDDYHFYGLWKTNLFSAYFWADSWPLELVKELGISSSGLGVVELFGGHFFVTKSEQKNMFDQICKKIEDKDEYFFKNIITVADRVYAEAVRMGEYLSTKEATLENFEKFIKITKELNFLWILGAVHLVFAGEQKLQDAIVEESFPAEHAMDIIPKLITPLYYRHKELVKLKKEIVNKSLSDIKKDKKLNQELKMQAEKYPWVEVFNFVGESMTPERLYEQIAHMQDVSEAPDYVPSKPLSSKLSFRTKCMHQCGYVKQASAEYFQIFSEKVLPFLDKIEKRIRVNHRELMALRISEIEQALKGEIADVELKKRAESRKYMNWVMIPKKEGGILFSEEQSDVELLKEKMIPRTDKNAKEIKGQVGNPGKYIGPVKVIMNTDDFSKMKKGDILVSTMTTPDFVILMQMAGAIVTDIGGMLCHAAIVSREINKPCVIATRFATQILKDGDMVEVDAEKGIVKIIK